MTHTWPWLLSLVILMPGCRIPNEDHCGRRNGDATCVELDPSRPYCSLCEAEYDGCVEAVADIASDCRADGAEQAGDTTSGGSESGSASGSETDTETDAETETDTTDDTATDTESTETGDPDPECGNGIKEAGEACDGTDFGGSSCTNPYDLPEGMLVCVADVCVIDTSKCCLAAGAVCEPGECCTGNCGAVTNKCGQL